jgi:protein O-mannosyl-transferase
MTLKPRFTVLFLIFISLGVYYPTIFAPLNSLDDQLLVQHLINQEGFSFARHFAPTGTYDYFRPLLTLTFEVDKYVGGVQESFMHLVNILLHTLNVILVFMLARRFAIFVRREDILLPFLSAALFALHPLNTEAVNWIAGRADLLAGTFVFVSLICILAALERHSIIWGIAGVVALFGGSLCKETALFLIPGIFLLFIWRPFSDRNPWSGRWGLFALCFAVLGAYFTLRLSVYATDRGVSHTVKLVTQMNTPLSSTATGSTPVDGLFSLLNALSVVLKVTGYYVSKLFQPMPLNFAIFRVDQLFLLPGLIVAGVLPVLMFRRRPVGTLFILSALLGSSALLVVFTKMAWTPIAERYMYIPCGLFAVAAVFGAAPLIERFNAQKVCRVAIPLMLVTAAFVTVERNIVWQDNLTLYQDTVHKSPDFGPAKNELAMALYAHNRPKEARRIIESTYIPGGQAASFNEAVVLEEIGDYEGARSILTKRLVNPGAYEVRILTMLVKVTSEMAEKVPDQSEKRIHYMEIVGWLERLEKLTNNPFHWYQLGRVHLILKNRLEAQRCFSEAARRFPDDSIYKGPATKLARTLGP